MWNALHLLSKHMKGVFDNLHMLWMGIWMCLHAIANCHHTGWSRFGKSAEILGHCLVLNEAFEQWLGLQTHMVWFSHPLHTYPRRLKTFICCGWGYGCVIMPLPLHWPVQIWKVG
jgi:hypothetical protein